MSDLKLKVRYFQDSTPVDVPCREENFMQRELDMVLPVEQTALVLVDLWNIHFIDSWLERAAKITREAIVPAIQAARDAGITIIHCPSPEVAQKFSQSDRYTIARPPQVDDGPQWPPADFRQRTGDFAAYAGPRNQPPGIGSHWDPLKDQLSISPAIDVHDEDAVIATGPELHQLLADKKKLHLIYAGFATNWCILGRDYGIRAMARHAYNIILLRDCTAGVEFPDTLKNSFVTEIAIREIEQQFGFSASNEDFFTCCQKVQRNE